MPARDEPRSRTNSITRAPSGAVFRDVAVQSWANPVLVQGAILTHKSKSFEAARPRAIFAVRRRDAVVGGI